MINPLIGRPRGWELADHPGVVLLLFGAAKLPELARGTRPGAADLQDRDQGPGRRRRDDADDTLKTPEQRELEARAPEAETEPRRRSRGSSATTTG